LTMPYIGLFTLDHMSYNVDRDPALEPSLTEMALKGINDLYTATQDSQKGFFIMVEASRIDHAGHANDPVGHLHDILEYNSAMKAMREWIDAHPDSPTTLISTADHECGGLTVGEDYWFAPEHFVGATATNGVLAAKWAAYTGGDAGGYVRQEILAHYGISSPTDDEVNQAISLKADPTKFALFLSTALGQRLHLEWSSLAHTGVDVTLYGWGPHHGDMAGNRENTEVGSFVEKQLGLNLAGLTAKLRENTTWIQNSIQASDAALQGRQLHGRAFTHRHD